MKKIAMNRLTAISLPGLCCLLTIFGLQVLPWNSAVCAADDSDSGAKNSSQKDQKDKDRDSDKANSADQRDNRDRGHSGRRAWIGVRLQEDGNAPTPSDHQKEGDRNQCGVETTGIYPGGPAARGGLRQGDRIEKINGKAVSSSQEVTEAIRSLEPGTKAEIIVNRNGSDQTLTITLGDAAIFQQNNGSSGNFQQRSYMYGGNPQGFQQGYGAQGYQNDQGGFAQGNAYGDVPEHAMMLEYNRRNAEQHQRLESQIEELLNEVRSLRKEVQQLKAK